MTNLRDDGKILDRPSIVVRLASWDGNPIIWVDVAASDSPPVRVNGVVWLRPGPATRRAGADDERLLSERRLSRALPFDIRPVPGTTLDDLDGELLASTYVPAAVDVSVLAEHHRPVPEQLASLRLCSTQGVPTTCGLLVGGFDPSAHLPGAYVQFVRYDGSSPDSAVVDEQELRGNLIVTTATLDRLVQGHLHSRLTEIDGFREEWRPDYPVQAIRELLINALIHRNYESSNAPVRLQWFAERLEIASPGGPFGRVRAENFLRVNDYRNPTPASALKTLVSRVGSDLAVFG